MLRPMPWPCTRTPRPATSPISMVAPSISIATPPVIATTAVAPTVTSTVTAPIVPVAILLPV